MSSTDPNDTGASPTEPPQSPSPEAAPESGLSSAASGSSDAFRSFLVGLATDPAKLGAFIKDPDSSMRAANLDASDQAILKSGQPWMIHTRLVGQQTSAPVPTPTAVVVVDMTKHAGASGSETGDQPTVRAVSQGSLAMFPTIPPVQITIPSAPPTHPIWLVAPTPAPLQIHPVQWPIHPPQIHPLQWPIHPPPVIFQQLVPPVTVHPQIHPQVVHPLITPPPQIHPQIHPQIVHPQIHPQIVVHPQIHPQVVHPLILPPPPVHPQIHPQIVHPQIHPQVVVHPQIHPQLIWTIQHPMIHPQLIWTVQHPIFPPPTLVQLATGQVTG